MEVDLNLVEKNKENIVARAEGRRLTEIATAFDSHGGGSRRQVDHRNDPLGLYIEALMAEYPNARTMGFALSEIRELESCLYEFETWEQYMNDARYIRLWVEYAALSQNPQGVLEYMESKGIGYRSAYFYEKWANLHETRHNYAAALAVVREGLKHEAEPVRLLLEIQSAIAARQPKAMQEAVVSPARKRRLWASRADMRGHKIDIFVDDGIVNSGSDDSGNNTDSDEDNGSSGIDKGNDIAAPAGRLAKRRFPFVSSENKENRQPVRPLADYVRPRVHPSTSSQPYSQARSRARTELGAAIFRDDSDHEDTQAVPDCRELYVVTLLKVRNFDSPVREFDPAPRPLTVQAPDPFNCASSVVTDIDPAVLEALYASHNGHTERFPDFFGTGPVTEMLQ